MISFNTDSVQETSSPTPGTAIKRASIITMDIGALPKKKSPVTATTKPMILPKSIIDSNPTHRGKIVRNVSAVKVVDVKHVITKRDKGKPILIVHNQNRKCVENPRQIIRINPNFELDNAASKSTGS